MTRAFLYLFAFGTACEATILVTIYAFTGHNPLPGLFQGYVDLLLRIRG